jgi:hypothetical protein
MLLFYLPQESHFSSLEKFITVVLSLLTLIGARARQTRLPRGASPLEKSVCTHRCSAIFIRCLSEFPFIFIEFLILFKIQKDSISATRVFIQSFPSFLFEVLAEKSGNKSIYYIVYSIEL